MKKTDVNIKYLNTGVRMLMLTKRSKEFPKVGQGTRPDKRATKLISRNRDEFDINLQTLLDKAADGERIYCSVNERNLDKAIRLFKQRQLDFDYASPEERLQFYLDIKNRWISCVMNQHNKATSNFLLDIDNGDKPNYEEVMHNLLDGGVMVLDSYETKNGWHIITQPYNYPKITPHLKSEGYGGQLKLDGLALLYY